MSSALSSPFMAESVAEVVPDIAKVAGRLAQSSVITGRRRVRLVPQSGQSYTSGNSAGVVNILIQDGQAYADLLSATLSFTLTTWDSANAYGGATANWVVPDDGAWSVFRRSLVSVNSTLMDDTDMLAKKVNAEIYATASQDWYNSVGSFCGLYKYNTTSYGFQDNIPGLTANGATTQLLVSKYDVAPKVAQQALLVQAQDQAGATNPALPGMNKYSVPVSLLTSFFRNDTLFPSRNAGQLYLQLNIASAVEACFCINNTLANASAGVPNFRIDNLTLEIDYVDLHPTYLEMMDGLIESPSGEGVSWAFDAHLVAGQNIGGGSTGTQPNKTSTPTGQQSVVISKASQNLRSLQVLVQPQAGMSSGTYPAQSTFPNPGLIDIQYRIGSLYFPAFTAVGENRAFMDLQNAFGSPESIDKCGLVDSWNYYLATATNGTQPFLATNIIYTNRNTNTTPGQLTQTGSATYNGSRFADMFMYAYCFDRLKHAKFHGIDLDGINTLTSAGSQMVVQLNANPVENSVLIAIVRFTRILKLGGGATSVIG